MNRNRIFRAFAALLILCALIGCIPQAVLAADGSDRVVKIGTIDLEGYASRDETGNIVGTNAEYAYKIAQYANLKIEIVLFENGPEALKALDSGKIDMMCNVIRTSEREEKYLFTEEPVGSLPMCVFVGKDKSQYSYNDMEQLKRMTYGVERGSQVKNAFAGWCSQHGITPNIRELDTLDDIKKAVDAGELDAGLYGAPSVEGYRTIQTYCPVSYYFVFRKTDLELKNRVDDAMSSIESEDPLYFDRLMQKYTASVNYEMEALTDDETAYVAEHPTLSVAVLEKDEPYFHLGKYGEPAGIIPDFYDKIAGLTGLHFTFETYQTQNDAVTAIKNGEADILGMYSDGQILAYREGLRISRAYANVDIVLLTRSQTDLSDVKTCAVKKRSISTIRSSTDAILNTAYLGYEGVSGCFEALKHGKADGMLCGLPTATWFSNQNLSASYNIITLSSGAIELCSATAYDNDTLCSILSKAIAASAYSFSETVASNTQAEDNLETVISRIPPIRIATVILLLVLLVAVLVWSLAALRKHQKEKVAILAKSAETDRRETEIAALEKAAEEKNAFFSNISHDMRTPLNAILGFSRLCSREDDLDRIHEYNSKIQSSGELLLDLINDTLTISKAGSGKLELHLTPVDPQKLLESIIIPIREETRKKNITFTVEHSAVPNKMILADELGVQKILLNLLSNAVKFTPEGGSIALRLDAGPTQGGSVDYLCTVSDNGIGISQTFLPRLFEPFAQEKRPGYETVGTGLGLSIVKQLTEMMGGSIQVQSEVGKGTTFTVKLRFQQAAAGAGDGKAAVPSAGNLSGKKILLCEDNELNREIALELLKAKGIGAVTAENGQIGVRKFAESAAGEYDAVLMDLRMPVMDGYETTRAIRALDRPDAKSVPILAMTADAFEDDVQSCIDAGMNGHISKPIDPDLLYRALAEQMEKPGDSPAACV